MAGNKKKYSVAKSVHKVDAKRVAEALTCPVCLDLFRDTVAVTACLHRFCQKCFEASLRRGNRECPVSAIFLKQNLCKILILFVENQL